MRYWATVASYVSGDTYYHVNLVIICSLSSLGKNLTCCIAKPIGKPSGGDDSRALEHFFHDVNVILSAEGYDDVVSLESLFFCLLL
jgi:hypothetical protein